MRKTLMLGSVALLLGLGPAQAAEPESCATVRMAEPGWSDLAFTTGTASVILKALGYGAESQVLGIPVIYQAMENKQLDVFLGYWDPAMETYYAEFRDRGVVETVHQNLAGAKYTWATLKPAWEAGLRDVKDVARFKEQLEGKVYGIEPGSNQLMFDMIADPQYGLAGFEVVESSEQGMLAEVIRAEQRDGFIVFQAWAPHPMNLAHDIAYLTGADAYYGPDFGGATVHTQVRQGYLAECPNVGRLLTNLTFTIEQESAGMALILDQGMEPEAAGTAWLKENAGALDAWLAGVTTRDGKEGLPAVRAALGL
jgi:glycine betaine/proline transport system substrate-binding protein